jgi:EAL domain-containing protein (putative c-di-GMP-specific phosphodiesterase class I)
MDAAHREQAALEADLRQAILRDEIEPYFQPIVDLASKRVTGFEMLARWFHATRGEVPPCVFIPVADTAGLIGPLTEWLLRKACMIAAHWPDDITLSCNIAPGQLRDRTLPAMVRAALIDSGLSPGRLEIELTESALVQDFTLACEVLGDLRALGVRLSLDDFGAGYSGLRHLQALPIDKIKIDGSFVRRLGDDGNSCKIVAAVVGLSRSLGLSTVAEGVEDASTAAALARLGCEAGQGWHFGRAVPATAVDAILAGSCAGNWVTG